MSVRYTARALAQLAEIFQYIAQDNPQAAQAVREKIITSVENLASLPFAGRSTDKFGVRVLTIDVTRIGSSMRSAETTM